MAIEKVKIGMSHGEISNWLARLDCIHKESSATTVPMIKCEMNRRMVPLRQLLCVSMIRLNAPRMTIVRPAAMKK